MKFSAVQYIFGHDTAALCIQPRGRYSNLCIQQLVSTISKVRDSEFWGVLDYQLVFADVPFSLVPALNMS